MSNNHHAIPVPNAASDRYATYCRPKLGRLLQIVRLDKTYHRAKAEQMLYRGRDGEEVIVTDFLGGYGASIFGHNHPALTETAMGFYASKRVFNGQSSCRREAGRVGELLHDMLLARTGKAYITTLANTGTEAMEAAIKHAQMERAHKLDCLRNKLARALSACRHQSRQRHCTLAPETIAVAKSTLSLDGELTVEAVLDALGAHFEAQTAPPPVFLALTRAFHGKTLGSVQLTYDQAYRAPFAQLGPRTVFIDPEHTDALSACIEEHRSCYLMPRVVHGRLALTQRFVSLVGGIVVEPLQGEGGIREVPAPFLAACRAAADRERFPLIYDEIQSGMGRTGAFLASEHQGVVADYYLLSKSLGGGVAKVAALLVEKSHYVDAFSMIHTSTFAEDDLSASVAVRALALLEEEDPSVYVLCQTKGDQLRAGLETIAAAYPDVIADVRGRGLMLGVEFKEIGPNDAMVLHMLSQQKLLGYVIAGYLLNEHRIRIAPTLSNTNTLRIEPSAFISAAAITRFLQVFKRVCEILHKRNTFELVKFIVGRPTTPLDAPIKDCRRPGDAPEGAVCDKRVAFIGHFISASDLALTDTTLAQLSTAELSEFLERAYEMFGPVPFPPRLVRAKNGDQVAFHFIGLMITSNIIAKLLQQRQLGFLLDVIHRSVDIAVEQGCTMVGFGGYCSIVTGNCMQVHRDGVACTSGNALTVGMGLECIYQLAEDNHIDLASAVVAVVGAGGNIGATYAKLIAGKVRKLILVGRPGNTAGLDGLASTIAEQPGAPVLELSTDMGAIGQADIIIAMSNASEPIIFPEMLKRGPVIINDLAVPLDTDSRVFEQRPDVTHIQGGLVRLPHGNQVAVEGIPLPPNVLFACMSETLLLGLEGVGEHFSYGPIRDDQVDTISALAKKHGFVLEGPKTKRSY